MLDKPELLPSEINCTCYETNLTCDCLEELSKSFYLICLNEAYLCDKHPDICSHVQAICDYFVIPAVPANETTLTLNATEPVVTNVSEPVAINATEAAVTNATEPVTANLTSSVTTTTNVTDTTTLTNATVTNET